ncbi:MAG: hypothetical protein K5910_09350 [Bacteroidales bacterium]|nr:hypothetical protein [Bacteroidales bacterium]
MKPIRFLFLSLLALSLVACSKTPAPENGSGTDTGRNDTYYYVNFFARNTMNLYYLWNKEIASALESWKDTEEPIAKVEEVRYKDTDGNDIDRWTMLTDDFESFYGSVSGNEKTYGFDFGLLWMDGAKTTLCAVVTYTYPDSPAAKAGLKRGDYIVKVNGKTMTASNYVDIVYDELMGGDTLVATLYGGETKTLNAVEMYENPVILSKTFDCDGKKVGYLVYTSFTLESYKDLIEVCKGFKEEGVSELILDLRYNGGGFAYAEEFLASMLAPEDVVKSGAVLSTEVFNESLTAYYKEMGYDTKTCFTTEFSFKSDSGETTSFSTDGANVGLQSLFVITGSGTASASEALIGNLTPYMDVILLGEQTHGKYCSGWMMEAVDFYEDYAEQLNAETVREGKKYTDNWGLYVMVGRFANKDGVTRCMPDGITPDYGCEDDPQDGYQLGDPQETMLAQALQLCGYKAKDTSARRQASVPGMERSDFRPVRANFGRRILPVPKF